MKALAKASRVNTALQVIQLMNNGMTIVDACHEVGVPRSTFYDICKRYPEAVTKVQESKEGFTILDEALKITDQAAR